jgi:hypothetical protein
MNTDNAGGVSVPASRDPNSPSSTEGEAVGEAPAATREGACAPPIRNEGVSS